ncbi:unnamed protein product [Ceutorhynchus assimilis]|uniref:Uncharacterized protein n=1 Tax=Ceutorhynchus assimilis TaxID=467358 RepID=A0A9N9MY27_9CUCU|nr:unnamed protein product [Ceutorhynchus assimilis]
MTTKRDSLSYQISYLPNSHVPKLEDYYSFKEKPEEIEHKISAFNIPNVTRKEPKLSQWDYLDQEKVEALLKLKTVKEIHSFIDSTLKNHPKGRPKDIFVQLLADVINFSKFHKYDTEKTATLLSQFFLTHKYFISGQEVGAEKLYIYFKDLMMCHSLPFPPSYKKVFQLKDAKNILEFFCKIYLRNLPLLKYLCLPNFALYLNYEIPPAPVLPSLKEKKARAIRKGGKKTKK